MRKLIFFHTRRFAALGLVLFLHLARLAAQNSAAPADDFMRSTGKIGVVAAVVLAIFVGLVWQLWRLDGRLTKIEHQIFSDNEQ